jgi:hypothetical protein
MYRNFCFRITRTSNEFITFLFPAQLLKDHTRCQLVKRDVVIPALWGMDAGRVPLLVPAPVENSISCYSQEKFSGWTAQLHSMKCQVITLHNSQNMSGYNPSQTNIYVGV